MSRDAQPQLFFDCDSADSVSIKRVDDDSYEKVQNLQRLQTAMTLKIFNVDFENNDFLEQPEILHTVDLSKSTILLNEKSLIGNEEQDQLPYNTPKSLIPANIEVKDSIR